MLFSIECSQTWDLMVVQHSLHTLIYTYGVMDVPTRYQCEISLCDHIITIALFNIRTTCLALSLNNVLKITYMSELCVSKIGNLPANSFLDFSSSWARADIMSNQSSLDLAHTKASWSAIATVSSNSVRVSSLFSCALTEWVWRVLFKHQGWQRSTRIHLATSVR